MKIRMYFTLLFALGAAFAVQAQVRSQAAPLASQIRASKPVSASDRDLRDLLRQQTTRDAPVPRRLSQDERQQLREQLSQELSQERRDARRH